MQVARPLLTSLVARRFGTTTLRRSGGVDPSQNAYGPDLWPGGLTPFNPYQNPLILHMKFTIFCATGFWAPFISLYLNIKWANQTG